MTSNPQTYMFNHSMIRVKDPEASLKFYRDQLGMSLIDRMDMNEAKFSLYFLAYEYPEVKGKKWTAREGILELTHNHGTESDSSFQGYHNGNKEPRGFGHVCVSVDNIEKACERLEGLGVKFQKRLTDGRQKDIAFALDPDGYWVELIGQKVLFPEPPAQTSLSNYRFNHTMIRVKDPKVSLKFYEDVFGFSLFRTSEHEAAKFTLYFLAYAHGQPVPVADGTTNPIPHREGVLELTWNWGTESDDSFTGYHNGNSEPRGFGHICVSVDDLEGACKRFEEKGVKWQKRLTDGRMKHVAFVLDPDNYWIEVIQNEELKSRAGW